MTLNEMLDYREQKMAWLTHLAMDTDSTLIAFRINAPGAEKQTVDTLKIFQFGVHTLKKALDDNAIPFKIIQFPFSTPEWLAVFSAGTGARQVKQVCIEIEENETCGRLYDFDVINNQGIPISRTELGFPPRKCFICDELAFICARERRHSADVLKHYIAAKADTCF